MPKLDMEKIKKTEPEDTLCYKGSVCCQSFLSCCFGAIGRHKLRSLVITSLLLIPTSLLTMNMYILNTNDTSRNTNSHVLLTFLVYMIYIFGSIVDCIICAWHVREAKYHNYESLATIYLDRVGVKDEDDEFSFLAHYFVVNLLISHTLMSLTIIILYLINADFSTDFYLLFGLFSFFFSSVILSGYIIYGLCYFFYKLYCLLIIIIKHCLLKPYYGFKNFIN